MQLETRGIKQICVKTRTNGQRREQEDKRKGRPMTMHWDYALKTLDETFPSCHSRVQSDKHKLNILKSTLYCHH